MEAEINRHQETLLFGDDRGDGAEIFAVIVPWNDTDETPLEAIARLNTEAIAMAAKLRANQGTIVSRMAHNAKTVDRLVGVLMALDNTGAANRAARLGGGSYHEAARQILGIIADEASIG